MTTTLYICMTSGIKGPEGELSEELSKEISDLALQLDQPWTGSELKGSGLSALSPCHYGVHWQNKDAPIAALYALPSGWISMWKMEDTDWHEYHDTSGIWGKLAPTGSQTYQKWLERFAANKATPEGLGIIFDIPKP